VTRAVVIDAADRIEEAGFVDFDLDLDRLDANTPLAARGRAGTVRELILREPSRRSPSTSAFSLVRSR
jgi:hypothetical protein